MNPTTENLEKAAQCADLLRDDLQAALRTADPVAGLLILQLIERAAELAHGIKALQSAREPQ